jgi:membrane-bound metal-dependent hydrolase YbcI (DUF457 family)
MLVATTVLQPMMAQPAAVDTFHLTLLAFKNGGWVVSLIGAAAMVGRLLIDDASITSWSRSFKHVMAAAIFAIIAFFVTFQWELSAINKAIIQGLAGALAPEIVDWLTQTMKEKLGLGRWRRRIRVRRKLAQRKKAAAA